MTDDERRSGAGAASGEGEPRGEGREARTGRTARTARTAEWLEYFDYTEADRERLAALRPVLEKHADSLVSAFYRHLLSFPSTRDLLRDPAVTQRLLGQQRAYLLSLAGPRIDEAYVEDRRRIGETHERVGLEPRWYLGAYALYASLLTPLIGEHAAGDTERFERTVIALQKLLLFDAHLAMDTYIERRERDLERLNRELAHRGRQLAHDYEERGQALRRTAERARAAEHLASVGTLVAGLAHEIGTPMGVIQGHAKILEGGVADEQSRWRLRTIQEQIARISRIIQSLLNMARPARAAKVPVALEPLLENTLAFLTEKLQRRAIEVERDYAEVPTVAGDPERLQQLFLNLFLNAADAMEEGGSLRVRLAPAEAGAVSVRVADTGPGIPEAERERIFEPFFSTKAAGEGNGLGLSVVSGIVSDHGAEIRLEEPAPGEGTAFRILFPPPREALDPRRAEAGGPEALD